LGLLEKNIFEVMDSSQNCFVNQAIFSVQMKVVNVMVMLYSSEAKLYVHICA